MEGFDLSRLVTSRESEEDKVLGLSLRPNSLEEFIGQRQVVENLKIGISAAKQRGEVIEHILLSGPPGLGKTTLAHIIAKEMGAHMIATSGPALERPGDLVGILTNLESGDVLFIDEIHRLPRVVEEFLYPAIESFKIDFVIDKGPYAKTIKFNLKPFTLIGATTRSGLLSAPMRSRFGFFYHLDFYEPEDLVKIILRSANVLDVKITEEGAFEIARRSRGTPRIANRLLRRVRDYAQVKANGEINRDVADMALHSLGIDDLGLDELDRKLLRTIIEVYKGGPVGIESLSATLNEEVDTLIDVVEPYLLKACLLKRTPRGREATELAYRHILGRGKEREEGLF